MLLKTEAQKLLLRPPAFFRNRRPRLGRLAKAVAKASGWKIWRPWLEILPILEAKNNFQDRGPKNCWPRPPASFKRQRPKQHCQGLQLLEKLEALAWDTSKAGGRLSFSRRRPKNHCEGLQLCLEAGGQNNIVKASSWRPWLGRFPNPEAEYPQDGGPKFFVKASSFLWKMRLLLGTIPSWRMNILFKTEAQKL